MGLGWHGLLCPPVHSISLAVTVHAGSTTLLLPSTLPCPTRPLAASPCPPPPRLPCRLQWGKMEPASGASFKPKTDHNLSLVEYELVPVSGQ